MLRLARGCDADIFESARTNFCTIGDNIFDSNCQEDGTHGEVATARRNECLRTGTSALAGQTCDTIISSACSDNVFEQTTQGTPTNLCTGNNADASDTYENLRLTACGGAIADLPRGASAASCNDADLSGAICGDGDSVVGSNPFAPICNRSAGNIHYGVRKIAREAFCRTGDIGRDQCRITVLFFCGTVGSADTANLFDPLCTHDTTYDDNREAFCTTGDTIFDDRCTDDHGEVTTARRNECLRTGSSTFADETCDDIVLDACSDNVFEQTTETPANLCTGTNDEDKTYDSLRSRGLWGCDCRFAKWCCCVFL